jgi:hypothetical protein
MVHLRAPTSFDHPENLEELLESSSELEPRLSSSSEYIQQHSPREHHTGFLSSAARKIIPKRKTSKSFTAGTTNVSPFHSTSPQRGEFDLRKSLEQWHGLNREEVKEEDTVLNHIKQRFMPALTTIESILDVLV